MPTPGQPAYPDHWEADVVLRDGGTAHIRPITPEDADRLVSFYEQVSDESKYYRFFAPYPRLSDRDVHRFTHHDYDDRVGLAATVGDEFLATVRYDRIDEQGMSASAPADRAEVAFLVQDAHQGRGLASAMLEHIAACARERDIRRFAAEVLPANSKMIKVFTDAGYSQRRSFADGSVHLALDLAPTEASIDVMRAREQRAEARSVQRLLAPGSVAVIGVSQRPGGAGRGVLAGIMDGGFPGEVYAVNDAVPAGAPTQLGGAPAYRSVRDISGPVDLAVLAVPASRVADAVEDCGEHGVQGLVVLSTGHSRAQQRELVRRVRSFGMRLVGPNAFGLINTASSVRLNASLAPRLPRTGRTGLFTQSAAIGIAVLEELEQCGAGLSTFVSAGNRADLSGNDVLQYWHDDPDTDVVLMYLESFGNPRKFHRIARRTATDKPVVVVRGGRHSGFAHPHGHAVPVSHAQGDTVSALLGQAGVIEAYTATELVDIGLLLAHQPLPPGSRVAVIGNAESMELVAHDACRAQRLTPLPVTSLGPGAGPAGYHAALAAALADPDTDAVVVTAVPTVDSPPDPQDGSPSEELTEALHTAVTSAGAAKPVVVAHLAIDGLAAALSTRGLPAYPSAERAVRALAQAVRYAHWRRNAATQGRAPVYDDIDESAATKVLTEVTDREKPGEERTSASLIDDQAHRLLGAYGIRVLPALPAPDAGTGAEAAGRLGYPVALKTTAPQLRHRADLGSIRLDIASEPELRRAYAELTDTLGGPAQLRPVVQAMAPRGVDTVVRATVDPALGAVLSFGLAGPPSELLGDVAYRLLPVTDRNAAELVRAIRAAPMLFGWRGAQPVDTDGLEELLLRLGRLVEDQPEISSVELEPVVVAPQGVSVLAASVRIAPPPPRNDLGPRRLPTY